MKALTMTLFLAGWLGSFGVLNVVAPTLESSVVSVFLLAESVLVSTDSGPWLGGVELIGAIYE